MAGTLAVAAVAATAARVSSIMNECNYQSSVQIGLSDGENDAMTEWRYLHARYVPPARHRRFCIV